MAEHRQQKEFDEKVVQVNRVSKKTKGGNKISFSVLTVIGDKKGRVGAGLGKAPDVLSAIRKGVKKAKKNLFTVSMRGTTIPHEIYIKKGAAKVLLKPAPVGTGVMAGGPVRVVVEAAGIKDIVSKILGTNNKASNVYAAIEALKMLKKLPSGFNKKNAAKKVSKKKK
ncbi:30S ribosomal protein S5 [Patescibacteria group bacterium]